MDVATVGDNCIDRYLAPVGLSTVGGNAVNVAVGLRRLGWGVAYLGAVGRDAAGWRTLGALAGEGVALARVRFGEGPTAWTELRLGADGERRIGVEEFGACAGYKPEEGDLEFLAGLRHVHIGWLPGARSGELRRSLAERGVAVSQDCAVTAGFEGLSVAILSAVDPWGDGPVLAEAAMAGGAALAVATCGARGSMAFDGRRLVRAGASPTFVADTTGAGDAFIAGFLGARLGGAGLEGCLAAGRAAGAAACGHLGGWPQVPVTWG